MAEITTEGNLDELLSDPRRLKEYVAGTVRETMGGVLRDHGVRRLPMADTYRPNPLAQGAALDGQFKRLGEFLRATHPVINGGQMDARLKALGELAGDSGGFLVPEEFRAQLAALSLEDAIVRPRAFTLPMSSLTVRIPAIDDTSHASSVFGGVTANWTAEAGTVTESEPSFAQIGLTAKKLTGYTVVGNELLADSAIALEALLTQLFGRAIRYFEDDAFINGDGAGQPLGIKNADCLVSQTKETAQAATTIVWENIVNMYARMLPSSLSRAVWLAHPDTFPQLAVMSLTVGTGGSAVWINNGTAGAPMTILGRPVVFTEKCETLGTVGDIYFADFGYYVIGDRQTLTTAASPHVKFTQDQTVYRFTERLDGRPWIRSALTPRNGTNTLSPFVALQTRS